MSRIKDTYADRRETVEFKRHPKPYHHSKEDQSHEKIYFGLLKAAYKKIDEKSIETVKNEIKRATFDDAIEKLNEYSSKGQLLPVQVMRYILKKFQNERYGTK